MRGHAGVDDRMETANRGDLFLTVRVFRSNGGTDTLGTNSRRRNKSVAKPEWGVKRACLAGGTRFYDKLNSRLSLPELRTVFEPGDQSFKPRRRRAPRKLQGGGRPQ